MRVNDIYRITGHVSMGLAYLGVIALIVLMLLTTMDVAGRYLFNKPVLGAHELTELFVLILIFSFLAHTHAKKGHISVDLLFNHLPSHLRLFVDILTTLICLVLMALIAWMSANAAFELKEAGEASNNLGIPTYPFAFFVVLGCLAMCLEFIRDLLPVHGKGKEKQPQ